MRFHPKSLISHSTILFLYYRMTFNILYDVSDIHIILLLVLNQRNLSFYSHGFSPFQGKQLPAQGYLTPKVM